MYKQVLDPVSHSLGFTSIFVALVLLMAVIVLLQSGLLSGMVP